MREPWHQRHSLGSLVILWVTWLGTAIIFGVVATSSTDLTVVGWMLFALIAAVAVIALLGASVALLPCARVCTFSVDGDRVVGVQSWFFVITDCDLRQPWWDGTKPEAFSPDAPCALMRESQAERWAVQDAGQVIRRKTWLARLSNVGTAPRGNPLWPPVRPPREGYVYALPTRPR